MLYEMKLNFMAKQVAVIRGFTPLENIKKEALLLKRNVLRNLILYKKYLSHNMRFKSAVGSSPPPFKRVVMWTPALGREGVKKCV